MKPKKHLGQNFLKSEVVLEQFLKACDLGGEDTVVEVGGGTGVITKALAPLVKKLVTFEFDKDLVEQYLLSLEKRFSNLKVINQDVLKISFTTLHFPLSTILGAIPYQITSPLLHKIVREFYGAAHRPPVIFIVQLEVAEKVVAKSPKASYLSNFVALYGEAEIVGLAIHPTAFYPEPRVESAILKVTPHHDKPIVVADLASFEKFLHHGFKNPRKMLNKAFLEEVLKKANINPHLRPQNLSLEDWVRLFGIVKL
ncbi:MAG: 16S rRNA (adenine(1518)-N(6)/adenine(1519)-N(6))-dimethyltransferase RsmA [bacterium]